MAVSKSYNRNQPIGGGFSSVKAYFSNLQNPARTLLSNSSAHKTHEDIFRLINQLPNQLIHVYTQKNTHFVKAVFNCYESQTLQQQAQQKQIAGDFKTALILFDKSLQQNPENVEARVAYSRLLAQAGKHAEALEHYRLAVKTKEYNSQKESKKITFHHPLLTDHSVNCTFEPACAGNTQNRPRILTRFHQLARAACLAATIALSSPLATVAAPEGQILKEKHSTPTNRLKLPFMAISLANGQDTKTLEGKVLNMSGEALKNSTLTLNTPLQNTTITNVNGYYGFGVNEFPTGVNDYSSRDLQPGAIKVEFIDLLGRIIARKEGYLNSHGEVEDIDFNGSGFLKDGNMYIQRITDKKGNSASKKIIGSSEVSKTGIEQSLKSGVAEADTFGYKINVKPDPLNKTFKDTTINVNGFNKTDLYHYQDLVVNEFVKIADNYKNGLDTIINSATVEFDVTKLFKNDNYKNLSFSFSNGFENYVSIDPDNKKIVLDRSKAPTKGNFSIVAIDPGNNETSELNISYNENAMAIDLIAKNSVTSELLTDADVYINSKANHFKLSDLVKDANGFARLYAKSGQTNVVRVDGEKYGFADALSTSDTIRAFVAPSDFPMAFYNDLNRSTGDLEVVKWEEGKQLTMRVLKIDAGTGLPLSESKYKELGEFGLTLENMMKEKGIDDKPFSSMKLEYVDAFGATQDNTIDVYFDASIPAQGFIGFSYKDTDPVNYVNLRNFADCGITIRNNMGEINTFTAKLQEYMSAFYGKGPPNDINIPEDGSLFKNAGPKLYITDSDVKVIKHHLNQPNGSWHTNDTGKNIGIEITKDAAKKNNVNELIPKILYFR